MLSTPPSLRLLPAMQCPRCGQLLVRSGREDEHVYCPECGYSASAEVPKKPENRIDSF
jgi:uncharacterized Zn finger protein (UPF0148 family)